MSKSLVNRWFDRINFWHATQKIDALAAQLARQCRMPLTQMLSPVAERMACEQLRGYVRAYATQCIASAVKSRNDVTAFTSSQISKAMLQAKELLIEMIVRDTRVVTPPIITTDFAAAA